MGAAHRRVAQESAADALLGFPVGPPERPFAPDRYGSYFQTPTQVRESLAILKQFSVPELSDFLELLERYDTDGGGLYATF